MYLTAFFVSVFTAGLEGLRVHGPSGPVVAQLGGSVLLPCFIESPLPLEDLQVEWRKMNSDFLVSLLQQGQIRPDLQSQAFRGRTDFFPDDVLKGNFTILIRNVVKEDAGGYRCKVKTTQDSSEVIMEVKDIQHFMVTGADQAIFASKGADVVLNCSVDSHVPASEIEEVTWRRMDRDPNILVLLYQDNEIFLDSSHESYQGRVDLFSSEIPKRNFSLKLTDVQMEDKGEFTCELHTRNMSGHTTVVLQGVGFTALHIAMLVLCSVTLLLTLGFCAPVFDLLRKKVASKEGMKRHIFLIFFTNICLFVTFCLWSREGLLSEVIACSTVTIMRPVILIKTSPYVDILPRHLQKVLKSLAFPLYHFTITMAACSILFRNLHHSIYIICLIAVVGIVIIIVMSVVYGLQIHLTVCLEMFNFVLFLVFCNNSKGDLKYNIEVPSVITPQIIGLMIALILQWHLFQEKPFGCVHIALLSVVVTILSLSLLSGYIILYNLVRDFTEGWIFLFESVLYILAWLGVIYVVRCRKGICSKWRKEGYLCCAFVAMLLIVANGAVSFYYLKILMEEKDAPGYLALISLVHVLAAICLFKHPKHLPGFLHTIIYMFGAVGLSTSNAIVFVTELILKEGKGTRTIEDLRVIVLPLETVYLFAWLALQIYDSWITFKERAKFHFKDERRTRPEIVEEMKVFSDPNPE